MMIVQHTDKPAVPGPAGAFGQVPRDGLRHGRGFALWHLWLPLAGFLLLLAVATLGHGDQWLADRIYAWGGQSWPLRNGFVADRLIHVAGRNLSAAAWLLVVLAWAATHVLPDWRFLRRPLASLLVAVLLSTLLVAWVKSWTNMDCPWDLVRYGGDRPLIDLFALRPVGLGRGACFPAGHASAGYAWMALYFFFASVAPRWRWTGLAVGVGLGLLFGFTQQLRGAHFLSHDVWTAALCWATALLLYLPFRRDADGSAPMHGRGVPA